LLEGWFFRIFLGIISLIFISLFAYIGFIYQAFNAYTFEDNFPIEEKNLSYYSNSYPEARAAFLEEASRLKKQYPLAQITSIKVPSSIDKDLSVDILYLPAIKDSLRLLLLSSGVHGSEGFTGSAVQQLFMKEFVRDSFLENTAVLLIHAVNPYGYKYNRRVSENNVDMNRNCSLDGKLYQSLNESYAQISPFINPTTPLDLTAFSNQFFFIKAVNEIRKSSMGVLRQAILQGQYQQEKGLYFGGFKLEPQVVELIPLVRDICKPYANILGLDLHTGYGKRGQLHLFPNPVDTATQYRMEKIFAGHTIDWGSGDDFYTITGDFIGMLAKINKEKIFTPMTMEFGTMDSQTTLGSLKSIQIMIAENQGIQYGYKNETDKNEIAFLIKEMYFPSSKSWQSHSIEQSREVFKNSLAIFTQKE